MMDRILTDGDILDILEPIIEPEKVARLRANAEDLAIFTSEYCVVAITQDAKTLKAICEGLVVFMDTPCRDGGHEHRWRCPRCMRQLRDSLRNCRLPWEK